MSTPSSSSFVQLAEIPGDNSPCRYIHVLPVRYAMSSEPVPPLEEGLDEYVKNHCKARTQQYCHYTLRLLRKGSFVHVYIPGYVVPRHVWEVADDALLVKTDSPAAPASSLGVGGVSNPAFACMLELPRLESPVWMAVTDVKWDEEVWRRAEENPALRMQNIVPATGGSPARSLVFPTPKIVELVEEFRRRPGFLRGLHEFDEVKHLTEPDTSHLDLEDSDQAYTPAVVERRWRLSDEAFTWKQVSAPDSKEGKTEAQLFIDDLDKATCPHYAVALADPAGLAMDGRCA